MRQLCHPAQAIPGSFGTQCRTSASGSGCSGLRSPGGCPGGDPRRCLTGCCLHSAAGDVEWGGYLLCSSKGICKVPAAHRGKHPAGFGKDVGLFSSPLLAGAGPGHTHGLLLGLITFLLCLEEASVECHLHLRWDKLPLGAVPAFSH